ncbi:hypothetical protein D3C77_558080 [compost metagenome]
MVDEARRQYPHETGQNDVIRRIAIDFGGQGGIEGLAAGVVLVVQRRSGNALSGGPLQAAGVRPAGDDGGDVGRPALVAAGFGQRLHVAAPPRNQDDKAALGKLCVRQDKESNNYPHAPRQGRGSLGATGLSALIHAR